MGLFKKIFKPVAKVLDKVIPNEVARNKQKITELVKVLIL